MAVAQVAAAVQVQSLVQEVLHAVGTAKKRKKGKKGEERERAWIDKKSEC